MTRLDWKKDWKALYFPPAAPVTVDVPLLNFLMIDGRGDPNTSPVYQEAVEALFSLSYTLKFAIKKAEGVDYSVLPAEGLWWVEDMSLFTTTDKSGWDWTMMIAQPEPVTAEWVEKARAEALKKKGLEAIRRVRFEPFAEGLAAQLTHTGPFAEEGPNVARLHAYIESQGCLLSGKHHEIYLSDFRRTAPERLKTVIRQPMRKA
ncbi:MAG TPA: GyrI-like domain-containing protein [Anaerolineaceae bacterium]|nr:GyrI-like domain-containing protein [Anaerolineaceae bacterium]